MATTHSHQKGDSKYDHALRQAHREARATVVVACVIATYFWVSLYFTASSPMLCWGFPLWFWVTIMGTVVLTCLLVWGLSNTVFSDMDYDAALEREA